MIVYHLRSYRLLGSSLSLSLSYRLIQTLDSWKNVLDRRVCISKKKYRSLNPFHNIVLSMDTRDIDFSSFQREFRSMKIFNRVYVLLRKATFYVEFSISPIVLVKLFDTYIFINQMKTVRNKIYFHEYGRYTILKRERELIYNIFIHVCFELLVIQVGHIDFSIYGCSVFQYIYIYTVIFFPLLRISKKMGETLSKLYIILDVLMRRIYIFIDTTNTLHFREKINSNCTRI